MIRHIVLLRFDKGAEESRIERYVRAVQELPTLIPGIVDFTCGRDVGNSLGAAAVGANWDFVVSSTFKSFEDYVMYAEHPEHKALVERHLVGLMSDRAALQIETPDADSWTS